MKFSQICLITSFTKNYKFWYIFIGWWWWCGGRVCFLFFVSETKSRQKILYIGICLTNGLWVACKYYSCVQSIQLTVRCYYMLPFTNHIYTHIYNIIAHTHTYTLSRLYVFLDVLWVQWVYKENCPRNLKLCGAGMHVQHQI